MVLACFLFAGMAGLVYAAQLAEPTVSPLVTSFIRVLVNLVYIVALGAYLGELKSIAGDRRTSLYLRGFFGSLALICSFASMKAIGIGESSFLHSSNSIFVALLSPWVLRQGFSPKATLAILGALLGLYMLLQPRLDDQHPYGRWLALASGLFAALAYLMIARAGSTNRPHSVVFYFCVVATVVHAVGFLLVDAVWPEQWQTYGLLLGAGLFASFAQVSLTKAYQSAPAALNAAVSYLTPVLNMLIGIWFFQATPDLMAWLGAAIVLISGVALPFIRFRR